MGKKKRKFKNRSLQNKESINNKYKKKQKLTTKKTEMDNYNHTYIFSNAFLNFLFFLGLTFLIFLIYIPAFKAGFYYDDNHTVLTQHLIRDIGFPELIGNIIKMKPRSLLTLTYWINFKMSYIQPWSYHLLSVVIHIINAFLVFILVKKLLQIFDSGLKTKLKSLLPYLVSIMFAVHPLMTEGVTYVSSRSDQLPTMMTFLSSIFFIKYIQSKNIINIVVSILVFYLGLLGKETGLMIAFVTLLIMYLYLRENNNKIFKFTNWIPTFSIVILFLFRILKTYGTLNVVSKMSNVGELVKSTPMIHYIYTELFSNLFYLRLLVFPVGQSIRHDLIILTTVFHPRVLLALGIFLLFFYLLWKFFRKNNLMLFGVFFYIIVISPVASIVRLVETLAEHRLYHPSFGFYLAVSLFILIMIEKAVNKLRITNYKLRIPVVIFTIIFITLSTLTYNRNLVWLGEIPLWTDALAKKDAGTKSTVIINNVGLAYFRDGQLELAEKYYRKGAVESGLGSYHNLANLGTLYRSKGEYKRAIRMFDLAIRAKPDFAYAHFDQGVSYAQLGDMENAKRKFLDTLKIDPYYLGAHRNLGIIEQRAGNLDKALEYFRKGLQLEPYEGKYYIDIAMIYLDKGDTEKAQENLKKAIQMMPNEPTPYLNLGLTYLDQKKPKEALKYLSTAFNLNNKYVDAVYFSAIAYDMMGDKKSAKKLYENTIKINPKRAKEAKEALEKMKESADASFGSNES